VVPLQKRHCSEIVLLKNVFRNPPQRLPKPLDLLQGVAVHRADPHHVAVTILLEAACAIREGKAAYPGFQATVSVSKRELFSITVEKG
jgi:hypothetical protein